MAHIDFLFFATHLQQMSRKPDMATKFQLLFITYTNSLVSLLIWLLYSLPQAGHNFFFPFHLADLTHWWEPDIWREHWAGKELNFFCEEGNLLLLLLGSFLFQCVVEFKPCFVCLPSSVPSCKIHVGKLRGEKVLHLFLLSQVTKVWCNLCVSATQHSY